MQLCSYFLYPAPVSLTSSAYLQFMKEKFTYVRRSPDGIFNEDPLLSLVRDLDSARFCVSQFTSLVLFYDGCMVQGHQDKRSLLVY